MCEISIGCGHWWKSLLLSEPKIGEGQVLYKMISDYNLYEKKKDIEEQPLHHK